MKFKKDEVGQALIAGALLSVIFAGIGIAGDRIAFVIVAPLWVLTFLLATVENAPEWWSGVGRVTVWVAVLGAAAALDGALTDNRIELAGGLAMAVLWFFSATSLTRLKKERDDPQGK